MTCGNFKSSVMRLKRKNTKWVVHHDCLSRPVQGKRKFERRRVAVKETGLGALDYGQNCWQYWPSTSCPRAMGIRVKEVYILVWSWCLIPRGIRLYHLLVFLWWVEAAKVSIAVTDSQARVTSEWHRERSCLTVTNEVYALLVHWGVLDQQPVVPASLDSCMVHFTYAPLLLCKIPSVMRKSPRNFLSCKNA